MRLVDGEQRWDVPTSDYDIVHKATRAAYVDKLEREREWELKQEIIEKGRADHQFTFTHMDNIKYVISNVPDKHCGYLLYLQCFIDYNGRILYGNNKPMSRAGIAETLGVSRRVFNEFMKYMVDNKIILADVVKRKKEYRIDKRYHWRGTTNNNHVIKTFHETIKLLYAESEVKDLGFIYKLLPYVNINTNHICSNPHEPDSEKVIPLNRSELAKITGLTEKSVYSKLLRLTVNGERVIAKIHIGREQFCKLNPFVFYRKDGYPDESARIDFVVAKNIIH